MRAKLAEATGVGKPSLGHDDANVVHERHKRHERFKPQTDAELSTEYAERHGKRTRCKTGGVDRKRYSFDQEGTEVTRPGEAGTKWGAHATPRAVFDDPPKTSKIQCEASRRWRDGGYAL